MKTFHGSSEESGSFMSQAVEVNGLVYFSGQIHADANLQLQGETIEEKFRYTMKRIEENLSAVGLSKADIIRIQIYIVDITELPALNAVYPECFTHPMPVRTAVGVASLPLGASLEIDVVASRE